ncbi:hypothetical protein JQ628_05030 [Bradyrhizobium lablabi]|uniref:hypothetical protein n=1 Tax=Bradyrhizobium lablabi TaxID=722472 RepID=UPI001BA7F4FB|nr:hypothetical protein [Bradyrhizobium lablabi]MBR1120872.1 hypothetical protein [Bradyrhizobium lablabi]
MSSKKKTAAKRVKRTTLVHRSTARSTKKEPDLRDVSGTIASSIYSALDALHERQRTELIRQISLLLHGWGYSEDLNGFVTTEAYVEWSEKTKSMPHWVAKAKAAGFLGSD